MNPHSFEVRRSRGLGPYVVVCDHASNFVPAHLNNLGLPSSELSRHIAWDIGAAATAELISERFDSPLILSGTSRLVVDCNRHPGSHDIIPQTSDRTVVPGNLDLTESDRNVRMTNYYEPYHQAIDEVLGKRSNSIFLSIHSMTDCLDGEFRPWPIALSSFDDRSLVDPLLIELRRSQQFLVGDNQPYNLDPKVDYSTPRHAIQKGLRYLQVEFRQDEIAAAGGQKLWAERFTNALQASRALASPA